ncbi:MAG: PepSY domain-containing protein [Candidatus Binatia bacterium]
MTQVTGYVLAMTLTTLVGSQVMWAEESGEKEHAELAKALSSAKVSLGAGLRASANAGKPISAKFEVEDGKLQLSVYTEKDGKFSEVVVDPQSGKVAKSEAITEREDLTAAKSQSAAMAKAKGSLTDAIAKAVAKTGGYRAVSVVPSLKNGHPIAQVELVKSDKWKTVTERLD